jgi:fructan beta-fructosidase
MKNTGISHIVSITGIFIQAFLFSCKPSEKGIEITDTYYKEQFRPQFHFSPEANWMNDPNGMVYLDGEYHLFYQYYPDSNVWGPMHWGHAVSTDMIHWKHLPVALSPDTLGYIFSGSAVADVKNSSGLGTAENPPLAALFTYHDPVGEKNGSLKFQNQGLAYSTDKGRTWTKFSGNPVLKNPGIRDFRDPKVFWHDETGKWVMILAVQDRIHLYSSPNLTDWTFLSEFGQGIGAHGGVWECPDLFRIRVKETNEMKWVMLVSINPGGPNGGSATQYFVGDFNGTQFIKENRDIRWVDWGRDNYAGVTWSNVPESDGRRLFLGWMSNWQYGTVVPTQVWRSAMTIPRELNLIHKNKEGYILVSNPVEELKTLRSEKTQNYQEVTGIEGKREIILDSINLNQSELLFNFAVLNNKVDSMGIILENNANQKLVIGYSRILKQLFVDRTASGPSGFSKLFAGISKAPYFAGNQVTFHVIVDAASVELFVDNGNLVMTNLVFPSENFNHLKIFSTGGEVILKNAEFHNLKRIW